MQLLLDTGVDLATPIITVAEGDGGWGGGVIAANSCLPIVTGVERLTRFAPAACDIM